MVLVGMCGNRGGEVGFKLRNTMEVARKNVIKITVRSIGLLVVSAGMGTLLLCFAYMLPTADIQKHVTDDVKLLQEEGNYTAFLDGIFERMHPGTINIKTFFFNNRGMARDNYTDALMLGNAVHEE